MGMFGGSLPMGMGIGEEAIHMWAFSRLAVVGGQGGGVVGLGAWHRCWLEQK